MAPIACYRGAEGTRGVVERLRLREVKRFGDASCELRRPDKPAIRATHVVATAPVPFFRDNAIKRCLNHPDSETWSAVGGAGRTRCCAVGCVAETPYRWAMRWRNRRYDWARRLLTASACL